MNFGFCPDCTNKLTDDSALVTKSSSIFKGNNRYIMCKNCNQVLLYNGDRDMIFDLSEYQTDENVLKEINDLLSEIDNNYEVPIESSCSGDCSKCESCQSEKEYQGYFSNKEKRSHHQQQQQQTPVEPQVEEDAAVISATLANGFLAVNKKDPTQKKLLIEEDLGTVQVDEWIFFELVPVIIEAVTTYKIERI
jgi:hypothetical protein